MKKYMRIKRLLLSALLFLALDELMVQRTHSVGFAALAAPVVYEALVATAAAASAVIGAYVISQTPRDILQFHSQALPAIHDQLQDLFPEQNASSSRSCDTATNIKETILHQSLNTAYQKTSISAAQEQAIIDHLNREVIQPTIERTKHITHLPTITGQLPNVNVMSPASPITVAYEPGKVRIDFKNINAWISAGVARPEQLTPVRQKIIQQEHARAMETAVTKYLWQNSPAYQNELVGKLNALFKIFKDINNNDCCVRTAARLSLPHLNIEEPYNYMLQEVIDQLIPLFFDKKGALIAPDKNKSDEYKYIVAQLLKNGITKEGYTKLLEQFGFHNVLDYEESLGTRILENIDCFFEFNWLPTFNWYPHNIRELIIENSTNEKIEKVIAACKQHDFSTAAWYASHSDNAVIQAIFNQEYGSFRAKYCDAYGIYKEYIRDPFWAEQSQHTKQELAKDVKAITKLNSALKVRSVEKTTLQKNWHIADTAPPHIHTALFKVVDLLGTGTPFIAKVMELAADYTDEQLAQIYEAFFLPNGVLKDYAHFEGVQSYTTDLDLFSPAGREAVQQLNTSVYTNHALQQAQHMPRVAADTTQQEHTLFQTIGSTAATWGKQVATYWYAAYGLLKNAANIGSRIFAKEKPKHKMVPVLIPAKEKKKSGGGGKPPKKDDDDEAVEKIKKIVEKLLDEKQIHERLGPGGPKLPADKVLKEAIKQFGEQFRKLGLEQPTKKFIKHILNKHFPTGAKFLKRIFQKSLPTSFFLPKEKFVELALETWAKGTILADKIGTKVYDFGRIIGYDKHGNATSCVKVVVNEASKTITSVYPVAGK